MALVTFKEILNPAKKGKYAVGSFNVWDIYSANTVVSTAQRLRSPVIISLWQPELDFAGEKELYDLCLSFGRATSTPVAIFIDHAQEISDIEHAIDMGATSVMIDGSRYPLDRNIEVTAKAAHIAHRAGVSIEGELGVLGEEDGSDADEALYTDPADAQRFAEQADIDAFAVAIGNAHGFYKKEPKLDLDRLARINSLVEVPLVLHGGSGIPDSDVKKAIELGITKVNIGAEARKAFMDGLRQSLTELAPDEKFPHIIFPKAIESLREIVEEKMRLFSSLGKA